MPRAAILFGCWFGDFQLHPMVVVELSYKATDMLKEVLMQNVHQQLNYGEYHGFVRITSSN